MKNIYLVQQEGTQLYKIGITKKDPKVRIKELQTGNANPIILVESFQTKFDFQAEAGVQAHYKSKKVSGEWFELTEDDVKIFYSVCERMEHSFEILKTNSYLSRLEF
jgi:hypothetical protein